MRRSLLLMVASLVPWMARLIEVHGVGHGARKMFASPEAAAALKP